MAYFIQGDSKYKIIILSFLKRTDIDVVREQIYHYLFHHDVMSYFDFQNVMYEMEEDGWIAAVPRPYGQTYRITEKGKEFLINFERNLPDSVIESIETYIKENRETLEKAAISRTWVRVQTDGSYMVRLCASEETENAMDIEVLAPTKEIADRIRENWERNPEGKYNKIFQFLLYEE